MFDTDTLPQGASAVAEPPVEMTYALAQPVYIMDSCVKVVINGADKFISLDTFLEVIDRSVSAERASRVEDMFLPSNVLYIGRSASKLFINCYYAGGVKNLKYGRYDRPSVVPNIIVSHSLDSKGSEWQVSSTKYFCTDLTPAKLPRRFINGISAPDRIFLLPFTNTYTDGRMCYGGNTMPARFADGNLRGLDWYYQYMFESPFNDDLGIRALSRAPSPSEWYATLAKKAKDGEPFPYDRLEGFTPLSNS